MSSFKLIAAVAIIVFSATLSSCGFSPLYGKRVAGQDSAEDHLALIQINQIKDRVGQQLHNRLLDRLTPKGEPVNPAYVLTVDVSESVSSLGVKKSAVATRSNLRLDVSYVLMPVINTLEEALSSGTVLAISGYDISNSEYTTLVAAQNARTSAVREAADDIRTRLAVYFRRQKNNP